MLHNTGQFGSDVPMNVNAQTNMTSMNDRMSIDNNINNLGKMSHPPPQPTSHFNLPDYGTYGLNMNTNLSHFQNFHPIGFQPSNVPPNPIHNSWQTSMLPMNLNMHNDQHSMLGYQYGKPDPYNEHKEHSVHKPLNIPQVQTKAFHKQMGMDSNSYQYYKPNFRQYTDYSLHMNPKSKPEVHKQIDDYSQLEKERLISPRPTYYEQNIDLSNKPQKMLTMYPSPYQSPELNLSSNKHENGGNEDNLDLSAKLQKYTNIVQKPINMYQEPRNDDNLDLSTKLQKYTNIVQKPTNMYQEPRNDDNLDLSAKLQKYTNIVQKPINMYQEPRNDDNLDLSTKLQKYTNIVQKPTNMYQEPRNDDNLDLSAKLQKYTNIVQKPLNTYQEPRNEDNLDLSSKLKYTNIVQKPLNTYQEPRNDDNIDLSTKLQKYTNIVQKPLNTYQEPRNDDNLDLSAKLQKYTNIVQKPVNMYEEPVNVIPHKTAEPTFSDNLNIPKPQNLETNLSTSYPYISSDLGKGFLKDQDSRRRSLENTVKMIENILSHSSNSRKSDYISQDSHSEDQDITDKNKSNLRGSDASVSNSSQALNSQSNSPSPSNYSNDESSQDSTNVSNDKIDAEDENVTKNDTNVETTTSDNSNIETNKTKADKDSQSASDAESSDSEDVKPPLMTDNNATKDHEIRIDNSIVIKVEVVPSIVDMEHLNPFHRDIFGIQNEDVANNDIIDSENSINVAKEVIRNGASVKGAFFECPHCNLYFNHPKRFLIHTKWHSFGLTNEKRLELQKEKEMRRNMRKEARVVERMNQSEVTDVNTPGRKFGCKDCDKVFNAKASLKNHKQRYHPTRSRDCKICGKNLTGWMALRAHLATHTGESGYQCSDCPKRFKHPHSLAKHRDTHLEKTHGCQQCPKKFGSRALLNVHMKTHERVLRGATFRCTYCGKGFFEAYSLQVHERTHRNERPFLCEICNTSFGTNSSLKRHKKVSHSTSKPFECPTCHRSFISEAIRDRHLLRNHGNPEDFKFLCKQCPCKYLKLKDLRKHMYKAHPKGKRKKKVQSDSDYA